MADHTQIEWTDATWSPITGCSVVSAGCKHCYAMKLAGTRLQHHPSRAGLTINTPAGPVWNGLVRLNEEWLDQPLRWRRRRRIFVCAHGDLFHESVPDEWIDKVFAIMALAPQHTFQVLTKRPERMRAYLSSPDVGARIGRSESGFAKLADFYKPKRGIANVHITCDRHLPLPNVWLGVSVENQDAANERVLLLLQTPAAVRWISAEPLLGYVDLTRIYVPDNALWDALRPNGCSQHAAGHCFRDCPHRLPGIDWVVGGGESGLRPRPMHPDWARSLRDQCADAGVPFLFKQWGAWSPIDSWEPRDRKLQIGIRRDGTRMPDDEWHRDGQRFKLTGKKIAGRLLDGVAHDSYPTRCLDGAQAQ